jgi:SAM-dependent methyltransferase
MVLGGFRGRLSARRRQTDPSSAKNEAQLRWWLDHWDPVIRAGGLNPGDALAYLQEDDAAPTYLGRRWQLARSQVGRLRQEAAIQDERFFEGKVVVDVGPGPVGFPDACPARISIGVDPLADRYAEHGLLLPDSPALYLTSGAEKLPLLAAQADVVIARDTLDYVESPRRCMVEFQRVLRPGGTLVLLFDVDHVPSRSQPNALSLPEVGSWLETDMGVVYEYEWDEPFGDDGHRVVLVVEKAKPGAPQR